MVPEVCFDYKKCAQHAKKCSRFFVFFWGEVIFSGVFSSKFGEILMVD